MSTDIELTVEVDAPPQRSWQVVTDWPNQGQWMLGTTVTVTGGDGRSVGSTLSARTGYGGYGFVDTMEITEWDPDGYRCVVRHTGRLVRGGGEFGVTALPGGRSAVHWVERLELPFGALGRTGWPLVRPAFVAGVKLSLRRLARLCQDQQSGPPDRSGPPSSSGTKT